MTRFLIACANARATGGVWQLLHPFCSRPSQFPVAYNEDFHFVHSVTAALAKK